MFTMTVEQSLGLIVEFGQFDPAGAPMPYDHPLLVTVGQIGPSGEASYRQTIIDHNWVKAVHTRNEVYPPLPGQVATLKQQVGTIYQGKWLKNPADYQEVVGYEATNVIGLVGALIYDSEFTPEQITAVRLLFGSNLETGSKPVKTGRRGHRKPRAKQPSRTPQGLPAEDAASLPQTA